MRRQIEHPVYNKLQLQDLIGRGSSGQIYKAVAYPSEQIYAVKVIPSDSDPDYLPRIEKQIKILMSTNHENIIRCHSVELVEEAVWIIMDYCESGSLADIMSKSKKAFPEGSIKVIMYQILKALTYLHHHKILHRDIKAANVLMERGKIKVADFGVSTLLSQTYTGRNTRAGSPFWMSPELLSKSQYSYKTDIWSLGITGIELAEGAPPYSHQHPYRAIFSIQSHPPCSLTSQQDWSYEFNDFIKECLTFDESRRPTAKELLCHPFFKNIDLDQLASIEDRIDNEQLNNNSQTFVLHSSRKSSIWEKEHNSQLHQKSILTEHCASMIIHEEQNGQISPMVVRKMKNLNEASCGSFQSSNNKENSFIANSSESLSTGRESLYREMEEQIAKVRKKYFEKIREFQEKNNPTFEQSLRNQKTLIHLRKKQK